MTAPVLAPAKNVVDVAVWKRAAIVGVIGLIALVVLAAPWMPPICLLRNLFHVPCPSCGFTRAGLRLLHGDVTGATQAHPLWVVVFPWLAVVGGLELGTYVRTGVMGTWGRYAIVQKSGAVVVVALIAVWIARFCGAFGGPVSID